MPSGRRTITPRIIVLAEVSDVLQVTLAPATARAHLGQLVVLLTLLRAFGNSKILIVL